jgi:hypothetical protein
VTGAGLFSMKDQIVSQLRAKDFEVVCDSVALLDEDTQELCRVPGFGLPS